MSNLVTHMEVGDVSGGLPDTRLAWVLLLVLPGVELCVLGGEKDSINQSINQVTLHFKFN